MYITGTMIAGTLLVITIIFWLIAVQLEYDKTTWLLFFVMVGCFSYLIADTPEERALKLKQEQINNQPKPILEKDGCTVYKFHDDRRDHYFTRCPSNTITEKTYQESCGKNCTRVESELIETTN